MPGNAIINSAPSPLPFFVSPRDGQLYQVVNATTVLHVNVLNTTRTPDAHPLGSAYAQARLELALAPNTPHSPLKLELAPTRAPGAPVGAWRWQGTMLYYDDKAERTNSGVFYQCVDRDGPHGLYMFLEPAPTPAGCQLVTLHRSAPSVRSCVRPFADFSTHAASLVPGTDDALDLPCFCLSFTGSFPTCTITSQSHCHINRVRLLDHFSCRMLLCPMIYAV